ncbi:hypothetical protein [Winogradskyella sp.]|uniref:hypothetical protein n=1 Tax=Winogradskyella sp. TaxID=1883156 RepID=UPI003514607B
MGTLKAKLFLKVFFFLLIIEFLVGLLDAFLAYNNSLFANVTSWLMFVFSLPISLISRDLPFYSSEGTTAAILFWVLNLLIQTAIIFSAIKLFRSRRKT